MHLIGLAAIAAGSIPRFETEMIRLHRRKLTIRLATHLTFSFSKEKVSKRNQFEIQNENEFRFEFDLFFK